MNQDKTFEKRTLDGRKKSVALLISIILALAALVGSTVSYFTDTSGSISSIVAFPYVPVRVEPNPGPDGPTLSIYNESPLHRAYVRVKFEVVWTNGNETSAATEGVDYDFNIYSGGIASDWVRAADGFWYYISPIDTSTETWNSTFAIMLNKLKSYQDFQLAFDVTSCTGVIADDDPSIVINAFSSGVSGVDPEGKLEIIEQTGGEG